jgi:hypothetical protein
VKDRSSRNEIRITHLRNTTLSLSDSISNEESMVARFILCKSRDCESARVVTHEGSVHFLSAIWILPGRSRSRSK